MKQQQQQQQPLPIETTASSSISLDGDESDEVRLIDVHKVERMFPVATALSCSVWLFLVLLVYSLVPPEEYVYLEGAEREAAAAACYIFIVSTTLTVAPLLIRGGSRKELSGIVCSGVVVQLVAMTTNGLLAWAPTVVVVDPVTHARVYLVRWCEWIPLAGLMTFLSEIVDCQQGLYGVLLPVMVGLGQSLSCLMAIIFPFCPSTASWCLSVFLSVSLFLTIFPRLHYKYKLYKDSKQGLTQSEMERSCRITFGFHLLLACSIVWTALVVFYVATIIAFRFYPDSYFVQNQALPMLLDTFFDVLAKAMYMKVIVDVHENVFDADGRARRQLSELKRMITVLWESSSDVIVISVRQGSTFSTMISPTFPSMLGACVSLDNNGDCEGAALLVKSQQIPVCGGHKDFNNNNQPMKDSSDKSATEERKLRLKSASYFVDASEIPYSAGDSKHHNRSVYLPNVQMDDKLNEQAGNVVMAAWDKVLSSKRRSSWDIDASVNSTGNSSIKRESLVVLDLKKMDGSLLKSEIKVSRPSGDAVIAIVRDVTERYLRFDAERKVHTEALARQRDAQAVNNFTRHEVKNGLLAGIELCTDVSKRVDLLKRSATVPVERIDEYDTSKCLGELDSCLHEILETVLAEAMAREVVHESYQPKLDRVDIFDALSQQSSGMIDEAGRRDRFPLHVCPANMPFLSMDPQLLNYIHRNAVSNACKYGKEGGKVVTEVHFFEKKGEFEMDVINEPGPFHEELMRMGNKACDVVFAQGARLELHRRSDDEAMKQRSSGDGGWISQKCAKTMGGGCTIRFDPHQTVFSFRCKVEPYKLPWRANEEFQVSPGTWGLALDDSAIQRKMMTRIMKFAGVEESKIVVKGKSASDIKDLDKLMLNLLSHDTTSKVLILMDENLDYRCDGVSQRLSGSKYSERALKKLTPEQASRTLVLVRSANDSDEDIATYNKRTHGFFPKTAMNKEKVRERLAPAWYERFSKERPPYDAATDDSSVAFSDIGDGCGLTVQSSDGSSTVADLMRSIRKADEVVGQELNKDWDAIWSALHGLKGDLMILDDNKVIEECIESISALRGVVQPPGFEDAWARIRDRVVEEIE